MTSLATATIEELKGVLDQTDSLEGGKTAYLLRATPLLSTLQTEFMRLHEFKQNKRDILQEARQSLDDTYLELDNLLYKRNHLESKIKECYAYRGALDGSLVLPSDDDIQTAITNRAAPGVLPSTLPDSEHERMLLRLKYELFLREQANQDTATLRRERAELAMENLQIKSQLEGLESQLAELETLALQVQAAVAPPPQVVVADERMEVDEPAGNDDQEKTPSDQGDHEPGASESRDEDAAMVAE